MGDEPRRLRLAREGEGAGPAAGSARGLPEITFEELRSRYRGWIRASLRKLGRRFPAEDLEDLEQEVSLRLWRRLQGESTIENPASYLYRVAATATVDAFRRLSRSPQLVSLPEGVDEGAKPLEFPAPGPDPERTAASVQLADRLRRLIAELPENRRHAVGLYLQGFTIKEVAELANWSEPKARNLIFRGLASLRQRLKEERYAL